MSAATYASAAKEFGEVAIGGKKIALTQQAEFTNRVFPGWFGDAAQGENYTAEYAAAGIDAEGNDYLVTWQFGETKGEETDDVSNYDWTDPHSIKAH